MDDLALYPAYSAVAALDGGHAPLPPVILLVCLTEDHERIAMGLNDIVIRRLFAAGLDLQTALGLIGDHPAASNLCHAIDELDQAIRDIRNTVFEPPGGEQPRSGRKALAMLDENALPSELAEAIKVRILNGCGHTWQPCAPGECLCLCPVCTGQPPGSYPSRGVMEREPRGATITATRSGGWTGRKDLEPGVGSQPMIEVMKKSGA
jgi:hypothetical protein